MSFEKLPRQHILKRHYQSLKSKSLGTTGLAQPPAHLRRLFPFLTSGHLASTLTILGKGASRTRKAAILVWTSLYFLKSDKVKVYLPVTFAHACLTPFIRSKQNAFTFRICDCVPSNLFSGVLALLSSPSSPGLRSHPSPSSGHLHSAGIPRGVRCPGGHQPGCGLAWADSLVLGAECRLRRKRLLSPLAVRLLLTASYSLLSPQGLRRLHR